MNYFLILGLDATATKDAIKKSYRSLAMRYHPDRNHGDKTSEEKFKSIKAAYEYLSIDFNLELHRREHAIKSKPKDEQKPAYTNREKQQYANAKYQADECEEKPARKSTVDHDYTDVKMIKKEVTSFFKHDDLPEIWLSKTEAKNGCRKSAALSKIRCAKCKGTGEVKSTSAFDGWVDHGLMKKCPTCKGAKKTDVQYTINIPPGSKEGSVIICNDVDRVRLKIRILNQEFIKADGVNLYYHLDIPYSTSLSGGTVEIITPNGTELLINVPPQSFAGTHLRVQKLGAANIFSEVGDIFYIIRIK